MMGVNVWGGLFITLFLSCILVSVVEGGNFGYVVSNLNKFQSNGGFKINEDDTEPSLEATSYAVLLRSLFGLKQTVLTTNVKDYVETLKTGVSYGTSAGKSADMESLRNALLIFRLETLPLPPSDDVIGVLVNLWDEEAGLFMNKKELGRKGDLKSTAIAFELIKRMNLQHRSSISPKIKAVNKYLKEHNKKGTYHFSFPDSGLSQMSANYYGILLGNEVGFDFGPNWANFIVGLQSENGGFYDDDSKSTVSLESTSHAVLSLHALQKTVDADLVGKINTDKLLDYVQDIPRDLRSAAQAHLAIAVTDKFVTNFETDISYDRFKSSGANEDRFIQGTQLKPGLTVKTVDGIACSGLGISVTVSFDNSAESFEIKLSELNGKYIADSGVETDEHLGGIKFDYEIVRFVDSIGQIKFNLHDEQTIGYGMTIDAQASLEVASRTYSVGDTVPIGTSFEFGVDLRKAQDDKIIQGDFKVIFVVRDSSGVALEKQILDGSSNEGPIGFEYSLITSQLPSGALVFEFSVADRNGIHSSENVVYQLDIPMIAKEITFEGKDPVTNSEYSIGDVATISIEPASFPDLRTPYSYASQDIDGAAIADQRTFVMDVKSPSGEVLRSIDGVAETGAYCRYTFTVPIAAALDTLGTNVVSFRYVSSAGDTVTLANFNSAIEELYGDSSVLNYTVNAKLYLVDDQSTSGNDFSYGSDVQFKFRLKDGVSTNYVARGDSDNANVYLSLKHTDDTKREFVSAYEAASYDGEYFTIDWSINPNAVKGEGFLSIAASDPDGNLIDLYEKDGRNKVRKQVTIGGNIDMTKEAYTSARLNGELTAFIVTFELKCSERELKEAQLKCSVVLDNGASQTVANSLPVATEEGVYSVSWAVPHDDAPSGKYKLKFYREVDRRRALENREFQEKRRRREAELRSLETGVVEADDVVVKGDIEEELTPLFVVELDHTAPSSGRLPIRAEIIVAILLGGLFFMFSYRKRQYIEK